MNGLLPYSVGWAVGLGLLLVLLASVLGLDSGEQAIMAVLGGMVIDGMPPILLASTYNAVFLVPLILWGTLTAKEYPKAAVFVFPRLRSRTKWLLQTLASVLCLTILFDLVLLSVVSMGLWVFGLSWYGIDSFFTLSFCLFSTTFLGQFFFVLLANILSLRLRGTLSLLLTWILYMPGQLLTGQIQSNNVMNLLPFSQSNLALHDVPALTSVFPNYFKHCIVGFTPLFSLSYTLLMIAVLLAIGVLLIRNCDLTV